MLSSSYPSRLRTTRFMLIYANDSPLTNFQEASNASRSHSATMPGRFGDPRYEQPDSPRGSPVPVFGGTRYVQPSNQTLESCVGCDACTRALPGPLGANDTLRLDQAMRSA